MSNSTTVFRTCPLCEATCGLEVQLTDGSVSRIRGDREDVFSKGFLCPKGTALGKFHDDPDRLRQPMIKRNGVHTPVSWDEAFAHIAEHMLPVLERTDREGSGVYLGNPVVHSLDMLLYSRAVTVGLGSRRVFSASTVDQRPREVASGLIYGSSFTIPVPDVDRSDLLMILGANPLVSNGSLATAPDWPGRLAALRERGGTLIVVDPSRTKTADLADSHLALRPGSDALLLAAIATELVARGLDRPDELDREALDSVVEALAAFTPASVAAACGIDEREILETVRQLADAERPCVYARLGTTVTPFGTTASWLVDVVNALLGALDAPGGAMFPKNPAGSKNTRGDGPFGPTQSLGRRTTAVSGLPIELGEHPVAALAEEIEAGNISAFVTIAGNPVLSCPDSQRLDEALSGLSYMVSVDCYVNETTRHADVILPPPSHLQKSHFDLAFGNLSIRNVANYSSPVLPLNEGALHEWDVLARLASVLGGGGGAAADAALVDQMLFDQLVGAVVDSPRAPEGLTAEEVVLAIDAQSGPDRILDVMLRSGPWGDWFGRTEGLTLDALIDQPHGIDLGPLESRLPDALLTPSGRPEFAHPDLLGDLPRLEAQLVPDDAGQMQLINRRTLRSNNSWMHNLEILVKGKPRCTMQVHPDDAARLGLVPGGDAVVTSTAGSVEISVELDDRVRLGVVSIPHGWGHDMAGTSLAVAGQHAGVNVNVLTPSNVVDPLSGTSQLSGIAVTVAPA
ncbi:MAG: molybdopterin-dependent oxidoreductase [Acidimicrobiia bacterium]|nr:molybdopterin-dependent oxidoreductase [Acidimicrobiia bacterium]